MPLPAALAAKLAKRGLVKKNALSQVPNVPREPAEEIIAENYDTPTSKKLSKEEQRVNEDRYLLAYKGHEGCPNKYNIYHECTTYCVTLWKSGILKPDPKYLLRKQRLIKDYPIPNGWREVFDRGCGRFYFWNVETDEVTWYPPGHPKAKISKSVTFLRENRLKQQKEFQRLQEERMHNERNYGLSSSDEEDTDRYAKRKTKYTKEREPSHYGSKRRQVKDDLDPMDPAAYSDIPKGTWASGLETRSEAKSGVDSTASGPLYQMRPYPSPGSILAANAKAKK